MEKAIADTLFGLFFGIGFSVSYGVIRLIISILSKSKMPPD